MVWKETKLPDGKILIPGVISHQTNVVEHPELVAWRIENYASAVGRENVIAGINCGFSQGWNMARVHEEEQWEKLEALVEGARLASAALWPERACRLRCSTPVCSGSWTRMRNGSFGRRLWLPHRPGGRAGLDPRAMPSAVQRHPWRSPDPLVAGGRDRGRQGAERQWQRTAARSAGRLVVRHHFSRCVDREESDGSITVVAYAYRGLKLNRLTMWS